MTKPGMTIFEISNSEIKSNLKFLFKIINFVKKFDKISTFIDIVFLYQKIQILHTTISLKKNLDFSHPYFNIQIIRLLKTYHF